MDAIALYYGPFFSVFRLHSSTNRHIEPGEHVFPRLKVPITVPELSETGGAGF